MCWNLWLYIVLLSYDLPGYISISKRKEGCKLCRTDLFYSHDLIYSRILFSSMYCCHCIIIDLFILYVKKRYASVCMWVCVYAYTYVYMYIHMCIYIPIISTWNGFTSEICGLFYHLLDVALKFIVVLSKGILKGHSAHSFAPKQSVTPNYWEQCGKNHL